MYDLFSNSEQDQKLTGNILSKLEPIVGLQYIPNFISQKEHDFLWTTINRQPWLKDIKRRVQHYGWKYDYKSRSIDYSMYLGKLPDWIDPIAEQLFDRKYCLTIPDQVIINEYLSGQGIAPHVDCQPCFGNTIISLSLGSNVIMDLVNLRTRQKIELLLEPKSLVVIADDARYNWTHGIAPRRKDVFNNFQFSRSTRISLTFRSVILSK